MADRENLPGSYKHLSGAGKRKKKVNATEQTTKLARTSEPFFAKFRQQSQAPSTSLQQQYQVNTKDKTQVSESCDEDDDAQTADPALEIDVDPADEEMVVPVSNVTILEDPASWPLPISAAFRRHLVSCKPLSKPKAFYPQRNGHCFNATYFEFTQNGTVHRRDWILYSETKNSLFCFQCSVFGESGTGKPSPFQLSCSNRDGFSDFNHKLRAINGHEESQQHFSNTASWKMFEKKMASSTLIDNITEKEIQIEIGFWKKVLHAVLDAILFLAKNNLAFRGVSSDISQKNCGNFLSLIKLLGNYYPPLATHLERLTKNKTSYLSPLIQNEFITLCGRRVRQSVLDEIRRAKYFSIMIDSTPDTSRQEQISQVIRIVSCSKESCGVKECFIDFIACEEKTGHGLSEVVISKLKKDDLDITFCRGQGYDNGANMAGTYNGVQHWILEKSPRAQFVPCAAHSLNLVGVNAAENVLDAKLSLGQIQNLFQYFHCSTSRWQILSSKLKINLKGQSTTRWSSRSQSVEALSVQYWNVIDALTEISTTSTFNADSVAGADSQLNVLLTFKFLLSVKIWHRILFQINICNLTLQKETRSLEIASKKLDALIRWLKDYRKNGFAECLKEATSVADEIGIDKDSGFENIRRTRGVRTRRLGENAEDAAKDMSNLKKFELSFFNELVDNLVSQMESRFQQIKSCCEDFNFLWGSKLEKMKSEDLAKNVQNLCQKYGEDFHEFKFANEVKYMKHQVQTLLPDRQTISNLGPIEVLETIFKHELESCFPNVTAALRIFLTLPVTVASNERSFSKLKIIKNYLRSAMGQERLSSLAILSIEHEVTDTLSFEEMISEFATAKCRKISLV